jgi:hypothetical protein
VREEFPTICPELLVVKLHQLRASVCVVPNDWMHCLDQEAKELCVGAAKEVESIVVEDPVVIPVSKATAMYGDVTGGGIGPPVVGGELLEIVEARQEVVLGEAAGPIVFARNQAVSDRPACDLCNLMHP